MSSFEAKVEIPPTAGLPLRMRDLLPLAAGDFSRELAAFLDVTGVGIECSGTASLVVILETLRQASSRRTVVVPAYTCPLVVFAVARCGLQLQVCDVSPGSFEFDPGALAKVCDSDTLAIVPTHLAGRVADLAPVLAVARQCGAYVIEDAAQALGAKDHGRSVGLRGDAGFFSLAAGKGLSIFEGGAWIATDDDLRSALRLTSQRIIPRDHGQEALRCLELLGYAALYGPQGMRLVYGAPLRRALRRGDIVAAAGDCFSPAIPLHRVSSWRQAVGCRALSRLDNFQQQLAAQATRRLPLLQQIPGVKVLGDHAISTGTWPVLFVVLPDAGIRDQILAELWGAGLGIARMFAFALPDYDYLRPWVPEQALPNARHFAACSLTISNSPWLDDAHFASILAVLARYCR
jgi:dTDP-4-amino-4,6-dideoxygalactose transaminase